MADKITPNDPRVQHKTANLNGKTYSYIEALPTGAPTNTIFLIHGWPDLSFGWRYQIPLLASLGLRVIVPDMMGYAGTEAPSSPEFYTYKRASDDMAALASHLSLSSIILGGHDWGGAIVFRIALWYPKLVSAIFSICTPFTAPRKEYINAAQVLPNFKYQLQLAGPEVEAKIVSEEKIRQFLNGMYGARTPEGEGSFSAAVGVLFDNLPKVGTSPLLSKEEMDYYVQEYSKNGMQGPLNWYRTSEINFEDEKVLANKMDGFQFNIPVLFVAGKRDAALPPSMSKGMEKWFKDLKRGEVDANHWALWEKPLEVNGLIEEFITGLDKPRKSSL